MTSENPTSVPTKPPTAKRTYGLGALVLVALLSGALSSLAALAAVRASGNGSNSAGHAAADAAIYQCPMHPTVVQDHPGNCPICGMKLVKVDKGKPGGPQPQPSARKIVLYRSPMDPKQTSPVPQKDEMGMDYLPVYEDEIAKTSPVSGLANIEIDAARQQLIGLRTAEASEGLVGGAWRSVGRVAIDETRVRRVNLKVPGFVERIYVDYVGKKVRKGDPLFSIYSPELLSTQEEYLLAQRTQSELSKAGGLASAGESGLVAGARRKLELWDISPAAVDKLSRAGKPSKTLTVYSPVAGVVTKKDVVEGMKLDAGAMPYEIVDLSSVWVLVDVYESELRFIKDGMKATLTLSAYPNREFEGKVVFLDPLLDPQSRTVKARLTFPNPSGELRPEMFGEVVLIGSPHTALRVPLDAVIDSGTQKVVFVALGDGKFEPRAVEVGESDQAQVEIKSGLSKGERVVVRANFMVDSESRLRASLTTVGSDSKASAPESARVLPAPAASHDGHQP
jgi:Cu(I)/Ag(I) efflux system membrane fusion protein